MPTWSMRQLSRRSGVTLAVTAGVLISSGAAVAFATPSGSANPPAPGLAKERPPVIGNLHIAGFSDPAQPALDEPLYTVDSSSQFTVGSQTGGAGAGKLTFQPLVVTIPADNTIPVLGGAEATGAALNAVVTLYRPGTTTAVLTETYPLVVIKSQEIKGNAEGVGQILSLEYAAVSYGFPG